METLPSDALRRVQERKLYRLLRWAYDRSPFYRDKFDRAGIRPEHIGGLGDLTKLPLTEKGEWLAAQR